ncbi:hypothetical protein, partial [Paenibacillus larvae]|uniref:hypothetical protein n=1 Tax=Paenibacillus larvae TaxID=1464 RepID=UPI0039FBFC8D
LRAMNMAPFIFWNLAFYTIIRTQLKRYLIQQKGYYIEREWACYSGSLFFVFNTFFSSMGEKLYAFLDIFKVIF